MPRPRGSRAGASSTGRLNASDLPLAVPVLTIVGARHVRSFDHTDFGDLDLSAVSVVIPAKECAGTIGPIVESIHAGQVLVIDASSTDGTGEIAAAGGAEVICENELMQHFGPVLGKGDAMWRSLSVVRNDVVVFVDGDTTSFNAHYVTGLAGPLLADPSIQ